MRRDLAAVKLFVSCDLEGAAGIVDWSQCRPSGGAAYHEGCRLLLEEVNAAIEGGLAAGATEVLVNDSHGAMANLPPDALAGEARYLSGRHKPRYMMEGLDDSFDAVFFVAYHGAMGTSGTLSHTYNPRAIHEVRLGGAPVGESGVNALVASGCGVPIALVTGDQFTAEEARPIAEGAEVVVVKQSRTRFSASSLHPAEARRAIRDGAARALGKLRAGSLSPPALKPPARLEVEWLTSDMAALACAVRGVERAGDRLVAIENDDPIACYESFVAAISITRSIVES